MQLPSIEQIAIIADVDPEEIRSIYLIEERSTMWFNSDGCPKDIKQFLWVTGPVGVYPGTLLRLDFLPHEKFISSTFRVTPVSVKHNYHDLHQFLVDHWNKIDSITELNICGVEYRKQLIYNKDLVGVE